LRNWDELIEREAAKPYYADLTAFLDGEYASATIYPRRERILAALELTAYSDVKAVILGQDPYHREGQAHGLSFSVAEEGAKFPPSLRNIFKELESDLGIVRTRRDLTDWAEQGILLLNATLTVRAGQAASHRGKGWEGFTDAIISALNGREDPVIFVLWGADAARKLPLISEPRHRIITAAHPSPLSAHRGFLGSKPFSGINSFLREMGKTEISW
jgi:uracil-DNA glycosylase